MQAKLQEAKGGNAGVIRGDQISLVRVANRLRGPIEPMTTISTQTHSLWFCGNQSTEARQHSITPTAARNPGAHLTTKLKFLVGDNQRIEVRGEGDLWVKRGSLERYWKVEVATNLRRRRAQKGQTGANRGQRTYLPNSRSGAHLEHRQLTYSIKRAQRKSL